MLQLALLPFEANKIGIEDYICAILLRQGYGGQRLLENNSVNCSL
jgi:hypothetical protein